MISWLGHFNYSAAIILFLYGIYVVIAHQNLMRKVFGMVIFQTGVILFYISIAFKRNALIPIVEHHEAGELINPAHYANPLPQALMLTAIVVGVATLGVALVLLVSIYQTHKTLEEDDVLKKVAEDSAK